jgi:YggT family protein
MSGAIGQSIILIVKTVGGLLLLAILLRFLLQLVKADFYNPVSQAVVKLTAPILTPLRKVIPGFLGIDFAALLLALLVNTIATSLMFLGAGESMAAIIGSIGNIIAWSLIGVLGFILNIYFWGLIISIIASWIAPFSGNPILLLLHQLLEPIQARVQRVIPPMGGLDFSPIFVFLGIQLLDILVIQQLARSLGVPAQFVIGI